MNTLVIVGTIGQMPEYSDTPKQRCSLRIAIHTELPPSEGETEQRVVTDWHNVIVWGRRAKMIRNAFSVGDTVIVVGRSVTNEWKTDSGESRRKTQIFAKHIGRAIT